MKRHFLTSAVFFFIIAGFFIASPKISHALDPFAVSNITDIKGATYSWVDMAHIQSVVNNNKETFYDPNGVQHYWSNGAGGTAYRFTSSDSCQGTYSTLWANGNQPNLKANPDHINWWYILPSHGQCS